jgi:hypothetical protein
MRSQQLINCLRALILGLLAFALPTPLFAQKTDPIVLAIEKVWKMREERFRAVDVAWTAQQTYTKGSIPPIFNPGKKNAGPFPAQDVVFDFPAKLSLQGSKARYERRSQIWDARTERFHKKNLLSTFNGDHTKDCTLEYEGRDYPLGVIKSKGKFFYSATLELRPLLLFFRPGDPALGGIDVSSFVVMNQASKVGKVSCVHVRINAEEDSEQMWLDPARDYLVLLEVAFTGKAPRKRVEIRYREDSTHGWVPEGWTFFTQKSTGLLRTGQSATITSLVVGESHPAKHFDLEFPPGCRVSDTLEKREWIVRQDDSKRIISDEEKFMPYVEIVKNDKEATTSGWPIWLRIGLGLTGLGFAIAVVWRLARRGSKATPSAKS